MRSNRIISVPTQAWKALRAELERVSEIARRRMAEAIAEGLLGDLPAAELGPLLEAHVVDGEVVVDPPPAPSKKLLRGDKGRRS
jgi:hypothetical protein